MSSPPFAFQLFLTWLRPTSLRRSLLQPDYIHDVLGPVLVISCFLFILLDLSATFHRVNHLLLPEKFFLPQFLLLNILTQWWLLLNSSWLGDPFFPFIFISWRLITLQYCSGFCHSLTWISHGVTCIPHPDPPSHLPLHPIPLGLPRAPAPSTCLMHPTCWWSVSL